MLTSDLIETLRRELPPTFARTEVSALTGKVVHSRTLANLMSLGQGPEGTFRLGRKVILAREPFLAWLSKKLSPLD